MADHSVQCTLQEAAEAFAVLAEFCISFHDSEWAHHHHRELKKIVQHYSMTSQTKVRQFFMK
ncbi:hypothetical protein MRX96_027914 [Rhipicephalus microplus]